MKMSLEAGKITIRYRDGRAVEGFVLARFGETISVAVRDADDAALFTRVRGTWVSEDCEPVDIRFDWHERAPKETVTEADCVCSKELAAQLIRSLGGTEEAESDEYPDFERLRYTPLVQRVV